MGILDVPAYSRAASDALYARRSSVPVMSAAQSAPLMPSVRPAVHPAPPTVTLTQTGSSAVTPYVSHGALAFDAVQVIGAVTYYDVASLSIFHYGASRGTYGIATDAYAQNLEFYFRAAASGGTYWVWIDDQPCTAAPVTWSGSVPATQRISITFPGFEAHRVVVYADSLDYKLCVVNAAGSVTKAPAKPVRFMAVGDSLTEGSGEAKPNLTWVQETARQLGWEPVMNAIGGTGYTAGAKPFTDSSRITAMQDPTIDFFHFKGSVNDDGATLSAVQAAAETCFQTIYDANPRALILVSGPDQTGYAASIVASRPNRDGVRAAALNFANKNVIGFVDPLKTAGVVPWTASLPVTAGQRVSYLGGIYEAVGTSSGSTFANYNFKLVSVLYGNGYAGGLQANGNRDKFILSDNVHWSLEAHRVFGGYFANHYRKALASYAKGIFYLNE